MSFVPSTVRTALVTAVLASVCMPAWPVELWAQDRYMTPPQAILDILEAPLPPSAGLSPDHGWLTTFERDQDFTTIADLAEPRLMLAGQRFPVYPNGRIENIGITRITFRRIGDATQGVPTERVLTPPDGSRIGGTTWTRDDRLIAYTTIKDSAMAVFLYEPSTGNTRPVSLPNVQGRLSLNGFTFDGDYLLVHSTTRDGVIPWIVNVATAQGIRAGVHVNHVNGGCSWINSRPPLLCRIVPQGRGGPPERSEVPTGPIVQESFGRTAAGRTFQDLLKDPHDEALFEYYFTNQIASIDVDGRVTLLGAPALHIGVAPSPDGKYLLVRTTHRPYSYQVPAGYFPQRTQVWSIDGTMVREILDDPLRDNLPSARDATFPGIRSVTWRPDAPATLMLLEALDGGDPTVDVPKRDRVSLLSAPFSGAPVTFAETELRHGGVAWLLPDKALLTESSRRTGQTRTWVVNPANPNEPPRLLWERHREDRYSDPGSFVMTPHPAEPRSIPLQSSDGRWLYLSGSGASQEGDRPFLDRIDLASGRTERLWRSEAPYYEQLEAVLDRDATRVVISRESPTERPNLYLRNMASGAVTQLTDLPDPAPYFSEVKGEQVHYARNDGIQLSATLYLPPGYDQQRDGALPFFLWAYPREYLSADAASQVSGSPYRFRRPGRQNHLLLLAAGYGVLDGPAMPIVSKDGKEPNDTYVEQLAASAEAAVNFIVERGVADRNRIAVGGHSYGAFMTANLLAHTDLFRTGVAQSGAYNRTLTPFGFQAEPRTYWQAPQVYYEMSPFSFADRIKEPILLIHGMMDNNQGTFPMQSERLFAALKGNGGSVRYVQLPLESHGYSARESSRHVLWEILRWLDTYVKGATP